MAFFSLYTIIIQLFFSYIYLSPSIIDNFSYIHVHIYKLYRLPHETVIAVYFDKRRMEKHVE